MGLSVSYRGFGGGYVARQHETPGRRVRFYPGLSCNILTGPATDEVNSPIMPPAAVTSPDFVAVLAQYPPLLRRVSAISAGVTHWFCRYHIQNFYGQHLDRLEGVLHELQVVEAAQAPKP